MNSRYVLPEKHHGKSGHEDVDDDAGPGLRIEQANLLATYGASVLL